MRSRISIIILLLAFRMSAGPDAETSSLWTDYLFIDSDAYVTNELRMHEFVALSVGAGRNRDLRNDLHIGLLGLSYGHRFLDYAAGLTAIGVTDSHFELAGPVITAAALGLVALSHREDPYEEHPGALGTALALVFLQNPEIRIFPIYPVQGLVGMHYDVVVDRGELRPIALGKFGMGINMWVVRGKGYFFAPLLGTTRRPSVGFAMDIGLLGRD